MTALERSMLNEGAERAGNFVQPSWLAPDGGMAGHVRAHDWAATRLGPIEGWSQSLRTTVGIILGAAAQMVLFWGTDLVALYNDAYSAILGEKHPCALGRSAAEIWAELWDELEPLLRGVLETGNAFVVRDRPFYIKRHGDGETAYFDVSFSAVHEAADRGAVGGVLCVVSETTERVLAERRQAFLLRLSDGLRPLSHPAHVQDLAARMVSEHLGADRVAYAEIAGEHIIVHHDYVAGVPSIVGRYPKGAFGQTVEKAFFQSGTYWADDLPSSAELSGSERAALQSINVAAYLGCTLQTGDQLAGAFAVHQSTPRVWTPYEISLVEEVAERIWAAVERAQAETALRASEARLATELDDTRLLQRISSSLVHEDDIDALCGQILDSARSVMRSDFASLQTFVPERNELLLLAHQGFAPESARHWERITLGDGTSCALAMSCDERVTVPDIEHRDLPIGTDNLAHYRLCGIRAMQSMRLVSRSGRFVGMISTHWRDVHAPSERELRLLDVVARQAADLIERCAAEDALRESEKRYRTLFESMSQGYAEFEIVRDELGQAVDCRLVEGNPQFERLTGLPRASALGRTVCEVVPNLGRSWIGRYERIVRRGMPERFEDFDTSLDRWFEVYAYPRGDHFTILCDDITARKRTEIAVRESEERQAFLLRLSDALRPLADSMEIQAVAMRALGEHLRVTRAQYYEAEPDDEWLISAGGYTDGVSPVTERLRMDDVGTYVKEAFCAGRTLAVADVASDPRVSKVELESYDALGFRAFIGVPLVKEGRFVALLGLHHATPREWLAADLAIAEETAERTWAAVERARAEARMRESDERFRGFAENSADVLWIVDAEAMRLAYLSPAFEAVWGESRERVMADLGRWTELVHPNDRTQAAKAMPRVIAGEACAQEYRIVRPGGGPESERVRWIRDTGFPIRDAQGRVRRVGGIAQDVTDERRAEERVAESERRLRSLVEGIPQLVWRAEGEGKWVWASPQWCAFTGLSDESSRGLGWLQVLHPDDREPTMAAWRAAKAAGGMQADFRVCSAGEKRYRWFQSRSTPLRDDEGTVVEWLGTSTDIDDQIGAREVLARSRDELEAMVDARTGELMAAEAALRQSQKMEAVGQLTGGIAHDFNNMLQGIAGSLELMSRRTEQGRATEAVHYVEGARKTVQRAAALTHRLLGFARQLPLAPVPMNLAKLAAGMAELIRRTVGPQIQVELRPSDGEWLVLCDENQMENALLNLCVNARDAMPGGGWLMIGTEDSHLSQAELAGEDGLAPGAYAAIAVTDTGVGMDAEVVSRAFEPFFTTKPVGQGTGLGLSQIYGFARQSGGFVRIESTPGEGTTVRLYLPRHESASAESTADCAETTEVVVLVEDEDLLRQTAAEWLREAGYRVLEAADGAAALRLLQGAGRVDALVTDVGLPGGLNGRQVAEAASERRPSLPVLFMTGYAGTALPVWVEVIRKPFVLQELSERLRGMLEAARSGLDADRGAGRGAEASGGL